MAHKEYKIWPNIDEFEIYDERSLTRLAKCYRSQSQLGWCGVNLSNDIAQPYFDIQPDYGMYTTSKMSLATPPIYEAKYHFFQFCSSS